MTVRNAEIASMLNRMADLLEIDGANTFRIRAYRNAADSITRIPNNLTNMLEKGEDLTSIRGVGSEISAKIQEIIQTGHLSQLDDLERRFPPDLPELLKVTGLGPRRVQMLYIELGVKNLKDLQEAAQSGKISQIPGFGKKTERTILEKLAKNRRTGKHEGPRFRIDEAEKTAQALVEYLRQHAPVDEIEIAGSYRRHKDTVGDLDLVVTSTAGEDVMRQFAQYPAVSEILSQGDTRSTVVLASGLQVDIRVIPKESYGAALFYFTGSRTHHLILRNLALDRGWKLNEYGLYDGEKRLAGLTEGEIYRQFNMEYIPPELREDRGEFTAAQNGTLPNLIRLEDMRGDLQSHTQYSDGRDTLEAMAKRAQELGYHYLAVTDHSKSLRIARGMHESDLARQIDEIDRLNDGFKAKGKAGSFRLLKCAEVDILENGELDFPDDMLAKLDLRVCAIHSHFNLSRQKQTERLIHAMDNPYFNILAHPTGRLLLKREPYDMDLERVLRTARECGCYLEINAHPERLDLNDRDTFLAKEIGVKLAISTDAHSVKELDFMRFGVDQARRGWLEKDDVLNTRSWPDLEKLLKR